jgi:dTDP-4-dehydrorhamnose reductase
LIFRTAWVFSPYGQNFLKTMLRLAAERDALRVVADQFGNPTSAHDLAVALLEIAGRVARRADHPRGVYHLAASGETTWFGFAEAIMQLGPGLGHRAVPVTPIATADYPTPAKRPANSRLDCGKLQRDFGLRLPGWRDSLATAMQALPATRGEPSRIER